MNKQKYLAKIKLLDEIIADLEAHKASGRCENTYALEANLTFFRSLYRFRDFWRWFRRVRPTLDGKRLLELSDFHLSNGKWERMLQQELLEIEKWKFPDILGRIRKEILKQIETINHFERPLILVNLGAGSMEIERQLITKLREGESQQKIIFFGLDSSNASLQIAAENLQGLGVEIIKLNQLDQAIVAKIKREIGHEQYTIVLACGDALKIDEYFGPNNADIVYHSKFRHHLPDELKGKLDEIITFVSNKAVENDDLNALIINLGSIKANWYRPILLNGALLSFLRDPTKEELKNNQTNGWTTKIYFDGYLRVFEKSSCPLTKFVE